MNSLVRDIDRQLNGSQDSICCSASRKVRGVGCVPANSSICTAHRGYAYKTFPVTKIHSRLAESRIASNMLADRSGSEDQRPQRKKLPGFISDWRGCIR